MARAVTTSPMTEGQINRAVEIFRAQLTKHAPELSSEDVQRVFGQANLGPEWFSVFRSRVDMIANQIARRISVDRTRTPQAVLDATGCKQYTDSKVVKTMPGAGTTTDEVEAVFFKPRPEAYKNGIISDDDLEREFEFQGLVPIDPYALAKVNEDDPAFADTHPNATHWKDKNGNWCYFAFGRWNGERRVSVRRNDDDWHGGWWFAGVRKCPSDSATLS